MTSKGILTIPIMPAPSLGEYRHTEILGEHFRKKLAKGGKKQIYQVFLKIFFPKINGSLGLNHAKV